MWKYSRWGTCQGVQLEANVEITQRNHQKHPQRNRLQRAHHHWGNPQTCSWMETPNRRRQTRFRRSIQSHWLRCWWTRKIRGYLHPWGFLKGSRQVQCVWLPRLRCWTRHVQHWREYHWVRSCLLPIRIEQKLPSLFVNQEHHLEEVRWKIQRHLLEHLRNQVQAPIWCCQALVWAQTHWWYGRLYDQERRWIRLGLQELRRRRPIRCGSSRIWITWTHDLRSCCSRWFSRIRGCSRNCYSSLQNAPTRKGNLHQQYC